MKAQRAKERSQPAREGNCYRNHAIKWCVFHCHPAPHSLHRSPGSSGYAVSQFTCCALYRTSRPFGPPLWGIVTWPACALSQSSTGWSFGRIQGASVLCPAVLGLACWSASASAWPIVVRVGASVPHLLPPCLQLCGVLVSACVPLVQVANVEKPAHATVTQSCLLRCFNVHWLRCADTGCKQLCRLSSGRRHSWQRKRCAAEWCSGGVLS